jgi:tRNA G18 (ribose-2'-O)-methylase SpoU/nucleoside-diphosphate-sugar epimerase
MASPATPNPRQGKVLIIGASGAIGKALAREIIARRGPGSVVACLHRSPLPADLAAACECEFGVSVREAAALKRVFAKHATSLECVWNLAAPLSVDTAADPDAARDVTVGGMERILSALAGALANHAAGATAGSQRGRAPIRVCFSDSIGSFGAEAPRRAATARWLVNNPCQDPGSDYGAQKRACRALLARFAASHGFDTRFAVIPGVLHTDASWGGGTTEYVLDAIKHAFGDMGSDAAWTCPVPLDARLPMIMRDDLVRGLIALMEAPRAQLREPEGGYCISGFSFTPAELFVAMEASGSFPGWRPPAVTADGAAARFARLWPDSVSAMEAARDLHFRAETRGRSALGRAVVQIARAHAERRCVDRFQGLFDCFAARAAAGQVLRDEHAGPLQGVVARRRDFSSGLIFLDVLPRLAADPTLADGGAVLGKKSAFGTLQVVLNRKYCASDLARAQRVVRAGDLVRFSGLPGKTRTGSSETGGFSVFATNFSVVEIAPRPDRIVGLLCELEVGPDRGGDSGSDDGREGAWTAEEVAAALPSGRAGARALNCLLSREILARRVQRREDAAAAARKGGAQKRAAARVSVTPCPTPTPGTTVAAERRARMAEAARRMDAGLVVVLENPANPHNAAGVIRTCDAFGVSEVCLIFSPDGSGALPFDPDSDRFLASSSSANRWVKTSIFASTDACVAELRKRRHLSLGTTMHSDRSFGLYDEAWPEALHGGRDPFLRPRVALWFGNESHGLSAGALEQVDAHLSIPMRGMVESLNLSVAAGVAIAEAARRRGSRFLLTEAKQAEVAAWLEDRSLGFQQRKRERRRQRGHGRGLRAPL